MGLDASLPRDRFTIVPIEGETLKALLPLIRAAREQGGVVLIEARQGTWPDTSARLEAGVIDRKTAERIRKTLRDSAPSLPVVSSAAHPSLKGIQTDTAAQEDEALPLPAPER